MGNKITMSEFKLKDERVLKNLITMLRTMVNYEDGRTESEKSGEKREDGGREQIVESVGLRVFDTMVAREDSSRKQAILHVMSLLFADKITDAVQKTAKNKKLKTLEEVEKVATVTLTVAEINEKVAFVWKFYDDNSKQAGQADTENKN